MMNRRGFFLTVFFLLVFCVPTSSWAYSATIKHEGSPVAMFDVSNMEWGMDKTEFENMISGVSYIDDIWNEKGSGCISVDAYLFGEKVSCNIYYNYDQIIDEIECLSSGDGLPPGHIPMLAFMASKLGMPTDFDETYYKNSDHTYYFYQYAEWPKQNNSVYIYEIENDMYCYLNDEETDIVVEYYKPIPIIRISPANSLVNEE